ncbi:MAG: hypothetical protein HY731_00755 [Candidatus Tectomicrobia bacterium]|nr:hypothetical protein [Candidatus Tectomicrobia bacterium]
MRKAMTPNVTEIASGILNRLDSHSSMNGQKNAMLPNASVKITLRRREVSFRRRKLK